MNTREKIEFENLVVSNKCKTYYKIKPNLQPFENLVVSNKCKTKNQDLR